MPMCADCGFLTVRDPETRSFIEVDDAARQRWDLPHKKAGAVWDSGSVSVRIPIFEETPVCCVNAQPIHEQAGGGEPEKALPVIVRERACSAFFKWRRGFSPKEHQTMWMAEELQRMQAAQREKDRNWQENQTRENRRWQLKLAWLAAGFTLANGFIMWAAGRVAPSTQPPPQVTVILPSGEKVLTEPANPK